jgi:GNAT superfamily N-acetyltransferase
MIIRNATEADTENIANLHAKSWQSAYRGILSDDYLDGHAHADRLATWHERFSSPRTKPMFVMIAELNAQMAGFICVFPNEDAVFGSFLDNLHVAPGLTGQGIGRQLLSEGARRLLTDGSRVGLYLWVFEQNRRARQFYERAAAIAVGSAENPMPDGKHILSVRYYWSDLASLVV